MAWDKPPFWLTELFAIALPERPGVERRKMFGCPCAFAGGHMFAGVIQETVFARLPPGECAALDDPPPFEPIPGRPMRAYVVLPEAVLEDEHELARLLDSARAAAAGLPPKVRKPPKARAGGRKASR